MKIVQETDSTVFYNLTIEDKNGESDWFITKYTPTEYWLNNRDEVYQGGVQSKRGGEVFVICTDPSEMFEEETIPYDLGNPNLGAGPGGVGGTYSSNYPSGCLGTVIVTTAWEAYQCGCGHWNISECTGCHTSPQYPGENQVLYYYCQDDGIYDNDLPGDSDDPIDGIVDEDPEEEPSIAAIITPKECTARITGDINGDCALSTYEACLLNGNSSEICICIEDGGTLNECIEDCNSSIEDYNNFYSQNSPFNVDLSDVRESCDENIDTSEVEANEKFMCIYNKLTQSPKFKDLFIDTFGESEELNVKFTIIDNLGSNGKCKTISGHTDLTTGQLVDLGLEIQINKSYLNESSAIAVAKTIMHESIHAYLTLKYHGCNQGAPLSIMDDVDISELLNEYYSECATLQDQHEFMFNFMIPTMSEILSDIKDDLVPINHQQAAESYMFINESNPTIDENTGEYEMDAPWSWDQFYKNLSLAGLQNSSAFYFELGDEYPENEQTPAFRNYRQYSNEIGKNLFKKECDDS